MAMSVSSEMTFFSKKLQSAICPQLRTQSSAEDRGRIDTRVLSLLPRLDLANLDPNSSQIQNFEDKIKRTNTIKHAFHT